LLVGAKKYVKGLDSDLRYRVSSHDAFPNLEKEKPESTTLFFIHFYAKSIFGYPECRI